MGGTKALIIVKALAQNSSTHTLLEDRGTGVHLQDFRKNKLEAFLKFNISRLLQCNGQGHAAAYLGDLTSNHVRY